MNFAQEVLMRPGPLFEKDTMRDWHARNASYCGLNIKNMEKNSLKCTKRNLKRRWPFVRCRQVLYDSKAVRHGIRQCHLQIVLPCKKNMYCMYWHVLVCKDTRYVQVFVRI